jgi:hypothetical protein
MITKLLTQHYVKNKEKRSTIMAGVNDRFGVSVEGKNVDVEVVKDAVKAVGLEKLAGM